MNTPSVKNPQSFSLMPTIVHVVIVAGFLSGMVAIFATAAWLSFPGSLVANVVDGITMPSKDFWPLNALAQQPVQPQSTAICGRCGTVEASHTVVTESEVSPNSFGSAIGGLIGLQFGGGREVGMLVGALAGKTVEKKTQSSARNEVTVRLGDGSTMVILEKHTVRREPGDRVKVVNGMLRRN